MTKYKPILKGYKEAFNHFYNVTHNPNLTKHDNIQRTFNLMSEVLQKDPDPASKAVEAVALEALIEDMNGNVPHFFIKDNSLVDFLKNTTVNDYSIVKDYILENSSPLDSEDTRYYYVAVHSEIESHLIAYLWTEQKLVVCPFFDKNGFAFELTPQSKFEDAPLSKMAVNFIYYIKAFPDKIIDGVPSDMVKNDRPKYGASKNYSIGIADEIVEKSQTVNGHLVSPHFRSGFFRHYTDDRYINMKGKVQFIAATMVKGKAKTVVA